MRPVSQLSDAGLMDAVSNARQAYRERNPRSAALHARASRAMPGGNTRTVLFFDPFPLVMVRGEGSRLEDADGHSYVDFLGEYTAGLYGHSHSVIRGAINDALDAGLSLGAHNEAELDLAEALRARFPSLELLRFTNSGTEANLMALTAARIATGRSHVLAFAGAYHGAVLSFADAAGSPTNVPFPFLVGTYNDTEGAIRLIREHGDKLAAVIVEPMLGAGGCIPGSAEFLRALRAETERCGAVLVFDEVMTSRLAFGGLQGVHDIVPDLTTLGKYLGGGLSFGAFGGRASIMERFDPRRPNALAHAGTFNNNVLSMRAGLAGLQRVFTADAVAALNTRGDDLRNSLNGICRARNVALQFTGVGSLLTAHFTDRDMRSAADVSFGNALLKELLFFHLLSSGVYCARRLMLSLSLPIEDEDCLTFRGAVESFLDRYSDIVPLAGSH